MALRTQASTVAPAKVSLRTSKASRSRAAAPVAAQAGLKEVAEQGAKLAAAAAVSLAVAGSANALSYDDFQSLTYLQVKGTGLANTCPVIETESATLKIKSGDYALKAFCMEPTSFTVKEDSQFKGGESEFVPTKLMTRLTYTLDGMTGSFKVGSDGAITLKEEDGLDYAPTTVQLAGGERVPFLFSIKNLDAKGTNGQFGGDFDVPSYRGASFLDPKGRGATTGYDNAVALPARSDDEALAGENNKSVQSLKGSAVFNIAKYDAATGEIAGVFESIQPSDTDLGAKQPKDIKVTGLWYAQIQ